MNQTITIDHERYIELLEAEAELVALHAGGVDNWEWYDDSLENLKEIDPNDRRDECKPE